MAERRCPGCNTLVEVGVPTCFACGHTFPDETRAGWTEGLGTMELPRTASAWLVILGAFPLTLALFGLLAWLDWFHLGQLRDQVLGWLLLFPLVAQLLPNLRRRGGGCCLGCLTWISVAVAISVAASWWSFEDPVRTREVKPVPRFVRGVPASVDGVSLGDPLERVNAQLGEGRAVPFPWVPGVDSQSFLYPGNTLVTVADGRVVRVEGDRLEQEGRVLAQRGQPFVRVGHLFETSAHAPTLRLYRDAGINYGFSVEARALSGISASKENLKLLTRPSVVTVNGVALGVPRKELSPLSQSVKVEFDDFDRSRKIVGTSLEFKGEPLFQQGDAWGRVRARLKNPRFDGRGRFAGVNLAVERDGGSIGTIEVVFPLASKRSKR